MRPVATRNLSFGLLGVGVVLIVLGAVNPFDGGAGGDGGDADATATDAASDTTRAAEVSTTATLAPDTSTTPPTTDAAVSTTAAPTTTGPPPTTITPTTTTTTTTTMPAETPEEFLALFVEGLRGDADFLLSRLNQATLDLFGVEQCADLLPRVLDPTAELELREIGEIGPWEYTMDGVVTLIEDALPVEVQRVAAGETIIQELHWQLVDGRWTWFSDCGDPLP